jgi:hypothetical protein
VALVAAIPHEQALAVLGVSLRQNNRWKNSDQEELHVLTWAA